MATNFPTSLQDLDATRGAHGNPLSSPNHITHHQLEDDTVEAIQAKLGANGSSVTTSHDYKLSGVTGTDKAVSLTGTEDLTNKSLKTGTKITLGSDATGDIYYRHSDGTLKRLAVSTDGKILKLASGVPAWDTEVTVADASTSVKGITKLSTAPASATDPIAVGTNDGRVPTQDENDALSGTGTPSSTNKYVTADTLTTATVLFKNGVADVNSGSYDNTDTTVIAHGLGRIPKYVRITAKAMYGGTENTGRANTQSSVGVYNGTTTSCVYEHISDGVTGQGNIAGSNSTYIIVLAYGYLGTELDLLGTLTTDATNLTITWTNASTLTFGIGPRLMWEAF